MSVTFPENPPVGMMLIRGIHGGYSVFSITEKSGRPLFSSSNLHEVINWMGVSMEEEDETDKQSETANDYTLPEMGSVGPVGENSNPLQCIKPGCTQNQKEKCLDNNCPFNFRSAPVSL